VGTAEHTKWFTENRPLYSRLAKTIQALLGGLLEEEGIAVVAVPVRAKSVESFKQKIRSKRYKDPRSDVTDLCGARVITYLESDVDRVVAVVRATFKVDEDNSVDKTKPKSPSEVGYRSYHLVCTIGDERGALPEYRAFRDCKFEVQVRTVLQHAWAEIEHDRGYKFGGALPEGLRRRLALAAANLESVDLEFARIAKEVDTYAESIASGADRDELDVPLTSVGLRVLLGRRASALRDEWSPRDDVEVHRKAFDELKEYGVSTLRHLDALLTDEFFASRNAHSTGEATNEIGLVRDLMLFHDPEKYFANCFAGDWDGIDLPTVGLLEERHGVGLIRRLLSKYNISVMGGGAES